MSNCYRVFGLSEATPDLAAMTQHLLDERFPVVPHFRGDDLGWTGGELHAEGACITVERFLTKEDDLRDQLDTWAGWLETQADQPRSSELMQRVIGTRQLIVLRLPRDADLQRLCDRASRWLAQQLDGIYQIDGQGFFAADGSLLLQDGGR